MQMIIVFIQYLQCKSINKANQIIPICPTVHSVQRPQCKGSTRNKSYNQFSMSHRKDTSMILQPFKVVNRQSKQSCEICDSRFQLLVNSERQCKRCMRLICEKCCSKSIAVYQPGGHSSSFKCCVVCVREEEVIMNVISHNRLAFNHNSLLAEQWMKKLNKEKVSYTDILNEYNEKIFETNSNTIKFKSESVKILEELTASLNYSVRQFVGRLLESVSDDLIHEKIVNTVLGIYAYLKEMPYNYELVYLVVFLLGFCNEVYCYFIVTRFIERVFPQYLKIEKVKKDNLLSHELKMVIDMYKVLLKKTEKQELDRVVRYLEKKFTTLIKLFLLNVTNITISFYLIDEILKNGSYIYLYKAIAALIFHSREIFYQEKEDNFESAIESHILKNVVLDQVKAAMIAFEKTSAKFEMDHEFFDSAEHRKLYEKHKQLEAMYQKSEDKYRILDGKHSLLVRDYEQAALKLSQSGKRIVSMQQELLEIADKLVLIEDTEKLKSENTLLVKRNSYLNEEIARQLKRIEEFEKKEALDNSQRRIFQRVKGDYEREIVDLKTKNQLNQIEKMANDINFNTSYIEDKIMTKNKRIAELETANNQISIELDFYRTSRPQTIRENLFNPNISAIHKNSVEQSRNLGSSNTLNFTSLQITSKEEKDNFKKYLEMSKEISDKLKQDLASLEAKNAKQEIQIQDLKHQIQIRNKKLELNEEINNFINQIPEELNYADSIGDLERIVAKETNLHKKGQLERVQVSFKSCLYEVRYRAIDAKLKQNKIKELCLPSKKLTDQSVVQDKNVSNEAAISNGLQEVLNWMGDEQELAEVNRSSIKREECKVM